MDKLICDVYAGDYEGNPDILALRAMALAGGPWAGLYLKLSQGLFYPGPSSRGGGAWFRKNWALAGHSVPGTWRRGPYVYADLAHDPYLQMRFAHSLLVEAGGYDPSVDLPLMLDVEGAGNPANITSKSIQDFVRNCADEADSIGLGRPILYGNIYLAEHGFKGLNGCQGLVVAHYLPSLPSDVYQRIGVGVKQLAGWQYTGTDKRGGVPTPFIEGVGGPRYPTESPLGPGPCDITAWQWPSTV